MKISDITIRNRDALAVLKSPRHPIRQINVVGAMKIDIEVEALDAVENTSQTEPKKY